MLRRLQCAMVGHEWMYPDIGYDEPERPRAIFHCSRCRDVHVTVGAIQGMKIVIPYPPK